VLLEIGLEGKVVGGAKPARREIVEVGTREHEFRGDRDKDNHSQIFADKKNEIKLKVTSQHPYLPVQRRLKG
jgi:hypothetical protein